MRQEGLLGGETMPEDVHPPLPRGSQELLHYLTFPMALNYQRNSYALWKAATAAFNDPSTRRVFDPAACATLSDSELRTALLKHRVALQPNKHIATWRTLSTTVQELFDGDLRQLFRQTSQSAQKILQFIQVIHKKRFPYLSGAKIANYWLYVVHQYTDFRLTDPEVLSIAPDTHVLQASVRLGVVPEGETDREVVAGRWRELLKGSGLSPIDIHTPLWLWSRGGFVEIRDNSNQRKLLP